METVYGIHLIHPACNTHSPYNFSIHNRFHSRFTPHFLRPTNSVFAARFNHTNCPQQLQQQHLHKNNNNSISKQQEQHCTKVAIVSPHFTCHTISLTIMLYIHSCVIPIHTHIPTISKCSMFCHLSLSIFIYIYVCLCRPRNALAYANCPT